MSQWIPVLVRVEDLEQVTALLSELETARGGSAYDASYDIDTEPAKEPAALSRLDQRPVWDVADLARLAASPTTTAQRWAKALDVCCDSPGEYLPTSQVALRAGMEITEWRDAPRKISRHLRAHYPDVPKEPTGEASWPLDARSLPEFPNEMSWAASKATAERWKQVRSARA